MNATDAIDVGHIALIIICVIGAIVSAMSLLRPASDKRIARAAAEMSLQARLPLGDAKQRARVESSVRRSQRSSAAAGVLMFVVFTVLMLLIPPHLTALTVWLGVIPASVVASSLASSAAATVSAQPDSTAVRVARARAVTWHDFASPLMPAATAACLVAAVALGIVALVRSAQRSAQPTAPDSFFDIDTATLTAIWVVCVAVALAACAYAIVMSRAVQSWPLRAENDLAAAWNDAMRSTALRSLAWAALVPAVAAFGIALGLPLDAPARSIVLGFIPLTVLPGLLLAPTKRATLPARLYPAPGPRFDDRGVLVARTSS